MTVAAYIRVSSRAQTHDMQRAAIERAANARGDAVDTWYGERLSGKTLIRPELQRLRADARAGHIRRLYVFRIDRLTRSGIRDTLTVIEEFRAHGVELVSISDGFDLNGPAAEIILAVLGWASKMERLAINERLAAARERLEAEGRHWGRPKRMGPDEVARACVLQAEGRSVRSIAMALRVPRATIARALAVSKVGAVSTAGGPANKTPEPPLAQ